MILFTILALTLIILVVFTAIVVAAGGATMIILFGDVIVCAFLIAWLIKHCFKKKK